MILSDQLAEGSIKSRFVCEFICLETRHIKGFEGMEVVILKLIHILLILLIKMIILTKVKIPHRFEAKPK